MLKRSIFVALLGAVLITNSGCCFFQRVFTGFGCGPAAKSCGGCANSGQGHKNCGRWGACGVGWGAWGASREPCNRCGNWVGSTKYLPGDYPIEPGFQGTFPSPGPTLAPEAVNAPQTRYAPRGFPDSSPSMSGSMPSYRVRGTAPNSFGPSRSVLAPEVMTVNEIDVRQLR